MLLNIFTAGIAYFFSKWSKLVICYFEISIELVIANFFLTRTYHSVLRLSPLSQHWGCDVFTCMFAMLSYEVVGHCI